MDEEEAALCIILRDSFRRFGESIDERDKRLMEMFQSFDKDKSGFLDEKVSYTILYNYS